MREKNENNHLYCQPALNVVVEIKGPFLGSVKPRTLDTDMIWRYRKRLRIHPEPGQDGCGGLAVCGGYKESNLGPADET